MRILDGTENVPFFVAKTALFPLGREAHQRAREKSRKSLPPKTFTSLNFKNDLY